jgi:hypothetical protein
MPELKELATKWHNYKMEVERLKDRMVEIEGDMLLLVDSVEGGSKTTKAEGVKIVVKRPVNRTIDGDRWEAVKDRIPCDLWPIRVKIEPDAKGCEWLASERPDLWAIAAEAISEKLGKPGFTIEVEICPKKLTIEEPSHD